MNLQAILVANITGFLLIFFLLISQYITLKRSRSEDRIFSWMMHIVIIACLVEALTFYVDGKPGFINHWINLLGNTYLYGANCVGSFLFCVYVDQNLYHSKERIKKIYYKLAVPVSVLVLSLLLNIPFGYYFSVDADNVYHRAGLVSIFYIYIIVQYFQRSCFIHAQAQAREGSLLPHIHVSDPNNNGKPAADDLLRDITGLAWDRDRHRGSLYEHA